MNFVMTINLDNDAFLEAAEYEVIRLLKYVAEEIEFRGIPEERAPLLDVNGNTVGGYSLELGLDGE